MTARGIRKKSRRRAKDVLPPRPWQRFRKRYPEFVSAYERLREAANREGPLDESAVALVKLATSIGLHNERSVHSHARRALIAGVAPEALRQAALVALPTIGLPAALDALRWIDESIDERGN